MSWKKTLYVTNTCKSLKQLVPHVNLTQSGHKEHFEDLGSSGRHWTWQYLSLQHFTRRKYEKCYFLSISHSELHKALLSKVGSNTQFTVITVHTLTIPLKEQFKLPRSQT